MKTIKISMKTDKKSNSEEPKFLVLFSLSFSTARVCGSRRGSRRFRLRV
ncbi:MAG: hypothetical protein ACFFFB_09995 [Candidatus Heimdallarchaeota archaeon]